MYAALATLVGVLAILAMRAICDAAGTDASTTQAFILWTGAPYLGYCGLTYARRHRPGVALFVLAATMLGAGSATFLYWSDLRPFIVARSTGDKVMSCGGPLVEFGLPLLRWLSVFGLWLGTRPAAASSALSRASLRRAG